MGKQAVETFKRKAEDEDDEETFLEWLTGKFNEKFIANIPSDSIRDLPSRYIIPGMSVIVMVMVMMLLLFCYCVTNVWCGGCGYCCGCG